MRLKITLDGPEAVHDQRRNFRNGSGSYRQIAENLHQLLKAGIPLVVGVNLDAGNLGHLTDLLNEIELQGWPLYPNFTCMLSRVHDRALLPLAGALPEDEVMRAFEEAVSDSFVLDGWMRVSFLSVLRHLARVLTPRIPGMYSHPAVHVCGAGPASDASDQPDVARLPGSAGHSPWRS